MNDKGKKNAPDISRQRDKFLCYVSSITRGAYTRFAWGEWRGKRVAVVDAMQLKMQFPKPEEFGGADKYRWWLGGGGGGQEGGAWKTGN